MTKISIAKPFQCWSLTAGGDTIWIMMRPSGTFTEVAVEKESLLGSQFYTDVKWIELWKVRPSQDSEYKTFVVDFELAMRNTHIPPFDKDPPLGQIQYTQPASQQSMPNTQTQNIVQPGMQNYSTQL